MNLCKEAKGYGVCLGIPPPPFFTNFSIPDSSVTFKCGLRVTVKYTGVRCDERRTREMQVKFHLSVVHSEHVNICLCRQMCLVPGGKGQP